MQLFCSTPYETGIRPPLASASEFMRAGHYMIWVVKSSPRQFVDEAGPLLGRRAVTSALILNRLPPAGKEWVFFEWHGRLLVDINLVDEVFRNDGRWKHTQTVEELNIAVFEWTVSRREADQPPHREPDSPGDFDVHAAQYRRLLEDGENGGIRLKREWIVTQEAQANLFGRYADPEIGGAIALLSLSGAAASEAKEFTLRTPAALGLEVDLSQQSLVAKPVRDNVTIRCMGGSSSEDFRRAESFRTESRQWLDLYEEARHATPASYFIALELDATVDPTIAIQRGAVFEHTTLVGIQTLAVTAHTETIVAADEVKPLILPAYCLNQELSPPHGQMMRPTPFVYRQASGTQDEVWRTRRIP
jgi:hypothetical protein